MLGILFSTASREVLVSNLVILGISPLTSFILELEVVLIARLVMWGLLCSIYLFLALHTSFLTTSFLPHHLIYLNR